MTGAHDEAPESFEMESLLLTIIFLPGFSRLRSKRASQRVILVSFVASLPAFGKQDFYRHAPAQLVFQSTM